MRHLCRFTAPDGAQSFLCYAAPGKTTDPAKATAFVSEHVALRAGRSVVHGDPDAFWNSERAAAENTRRAHRGWTFEAVPEASH